MSEDATKIVPLRPGTRPEITTVIKEPHEGVIRHLETLLQDARAGEIVGIVVAYQGPDWRAACSVVGFVGGYSLQGAAHCVLSEILDINRGLSHTDEEE